MKKSHARTAWIVGLVAGASVLGVGAYALTGGGTAAASPTPSGSGSGGGGGTSAKSGSPSTAPKVPVTVQPKGVATSTGGPAGAPPKSVPRGITIPSGSSLLQGSSTNPIVSQNLTLAPGQLAAQTISVSGTKFPASIWLVGGTNIAATIESLPNSDAGCIQANAAVITAGNSVNAASCPDLYSSGSIGATVSVSWTDSNGNSQQSAFPVTLVP